VNSVSTFRGCRTIAIFRLVAFCLLVGGCATRVSLSPTAEGLLPSARLPLKIGLYYGVEFQGYVQEDRYQGLVLPVGRASAELLQEIFGALFEGTVPVLSRPPLPTQEPTIAAVIEPAIEVFDLGSGALESAELSWAEIGYRFTLWSLKGEVIASWTVTGSGSVEGDGSLGRRVSEVRAADLAMRNAAAQFLATFRAVPEVRQWLRDIGVEVAPATGLWLSLRSVGAKR
jgi:hypothetical protein